MIKILNKAYQVGDKAFPSLEEAQTEEITQIPCEIGTFTGDIANWIIKNKARILDILTTKNNSRPSRRKINKKPGEVVQTAVL